MTRVSARATRPKRPVSVTLVTLLALAVAVYSAIYGALALRGDPGGERSPTASVSGSVRTGRNVDRSGRPLLLVTLVARAQTAGVVARHGAVVAGASAPTARAVPRPKGGEAET